MLFENYSQEVGGPIQCWSPSLKVGGTSLPRSLWLGCWDYANSDPDLNLNPNDIISTFLRLSSGSQGGILGVNHPGKKSPALISSMVSPQAADNFDVPQKNTYNLLQFELL